ncbi:MAG: hypothetical protein KatS3mg008_1691 [Acidimicrobiales bacterium]|nr:MAG: hypothetical protein KatS3mg008_1691 [Acidimicrobiales bacterium]
MSTFALFVVVPVITAFIGWFTNWAALRMIFHPKNFVGVWKLGWQGVLPRRADKFASDVADTVTSEIISARDLASRFDAREMAEVFEQILDDYAEDLVAEAAEIIQPGSWRALPEDGRRFVVEVVKKEAHRAAQEIFEDLQGISDELLDLRRLITSLLTGDEVDRLIRLFKTMGRVEFRFIERFGGVFGLLVGLVQVALFDLFGKAWTMPPVGAIVGLGTNWLAIQMIFRPREPVRVGPFSYQGLFPRRQDEIAEDYGKIAADEIFTARNLFRLVAESEAGARIAAMVLQKTRERIEAQKPTIEALAQTEVSDNHVAAIQALIVRRVVEVAPEVRPRIEEFVEEKLDVANLVSSKLKALSKPEFERMLRSLLEEDEWILIALGGVLGFAIGVAQAAVAGVFAA